MKAKLISKTLIARHAPNYGDAEPVVSACDGRKYPLSEVIADIELSTARIIYLGAVFVATGIPPYTQYTFTVVVPMVEHALIQKYLTGEDDDDETKEDDGKGDQEDTDSFAQEDKNHG